MLDIHHNAKIYQLLNLNVAIDRYKIDINFLLKIVCRPIIIVENKCLDGILICVKQS